MTLTFVFLATVIALAFALAFLFAIPEVNLLLTPPTAGGHP